MVEQSVEEMQREIERLNGLVDALKRGNQDLMYKLEKLRKSKIPKVIIVDKGPKIRDEIMDLCERNEMLLKENDLLKETIDLDDSKVRVGELEQLLHLSDQIVVELEEENKTLKSERQQMQGKIMSLEITINSYKDRERKPIIYEGEEHDFYQDEQKEFIMDAIEAKMNASEINSRAYGLGRSLIEANPVQGHRDAIRKEIMNIFRHYDGYNRMNVGDVRRLRELGIEITSSGAHPCVKFIKSDKYFATIASTPSCNRSLNDATNICKSLL